MPAASSPRESASPSPSTVRSTGWNTVVWNDPINLQSYVVHVFRTHFGFDRPRAVKHMKQVHHEGRSILSTDDRETAEGHVMAMHSYGLQATMEPAEGSE